MTKAAYIFCWKLTGGPPFTLSVPRFPVSAVVSWPVGSVSCLVLLVQEVWEVCG